MGVNETIFPSKKERRHFEHLKELWGTEYRLYSNLPFLTVFNVERLADWTDWQNPKPFSVSAADVKRLKKTSIDYTLCSTDDKPLVCIEFDGLYQGFNIGSKYAAPYRSTPWRHKITNLKLKVAHGSLFPFFVMGSSQFVIIDATDRLAIVDCIIGAVLAGKYMDQRFAEGFDPQEAGFDDLEFEKLPRHVQNSILEDWCVGVEVDSKFKKNPLFKIRYELQERLGVRRWSHGMVEPPQLAGIDDPSERAKIRKEINVIGSRASIELPTGATFSATVWIPDFQTPGYSPYSFIDDLAVYVALRRAERRSRHRKKSS